jgi:hypothetical protein
MCDDGDDAIVAQDDAVCASLTVGLDSNRGYVLVAVCSFCRTYVRTECI